MFVIVMIGFAALGVFLLLAAFSVPFLLLWRIWRWTRPGQLVVRSLIVVTAVGIMASPYFAYTALDRRFVLLHVPKPLDVAEIEYRIESDWIGALGPGGNETAFIVYRLTDESADWARKQGDALGQKLNGGGSAWLDTPMRGWEPAGNSVPIIWADVPVEDGRDDDANRAMTSPGSLYALGQGGSITIVDPALGKVYFVVPW